MGMTRIRRPRPSIHGRRPVHMAHGLWFASCGVRLGCSARRGLHRVCVPWRRPARARVSAAASAAAHHDGSRTWQAGCLISRALRPAGCYYYTYADGRPALIPSACAPHAAASHTLAPGAPLVAAAAPLLCEPCDGGPKGPAAAAPSPSAARQAPILITEEDLLAAVGEAAGRTLEAAERAGGAGGARGGGRGALVLEEDLIALLVRSPTAGTDADANPPAGAVAGAAIAAGSCGVAAGARAGRRTVRASPGHLAACGHACLYGAAEATRSAAAARARERVGDWRARPDRPAAARGGGGRIWWDSDARARPPLRMIGA
jgi:hypothetical protein